MPNKQQPKQPPKTPRAKRPKVAQPPGGLKLWEVKLTKLYQTEWLAASREEAIEQMVDWLMRENPLETSNNVTAKALRAATAEEIADAYNSADAPDDGDPGDEDERADNGDLPADVFAEYLASVEVDETDDDEVFD